MPRRKPVVLNLNGWLSPDEAEALRAEINKWMAANNAATALINEQMAEVHRLREALQQVNALTHEDGSWLRCKACDRIAQICADMLPGQRA